MMTAVEPRLTANALDILTARYLARDDCGRVVETAAEMFGAHRRAFGMEPGRARC